MDPRLVDACRQFEAVMMRPFFDALKLGQMPALATDDAGADDSDAQQPGSAIVQSLFTDAFAMALARAGGFGLADALARTVSGRAT
jgi:Rod binding domain-containing protein